MAHASRSATRSTTSTSRRSPANCATGSSTSRPGATPASRAMPRRPRASASSRWSRCDVADVRVADLRPPDTLAARAAREVVAQYSSSAMVNHCERAYLWSATLGELTGAAYDRELLYVASMLHDLGLMPAFDNYRAPFEDAGGDVGWVFAAGTGWPPERRTRVKDIIVRHMWSEVDPSFDAEGHLLCEGTGLDISGRNADAWPADFRAGVVERFPRLGLPTEFLAAFQDQAGRKPGCAAAAAVASGLADRIATNPL